MENDYLSEKIGAIKNEMSHIWGGIFVMGGGAITLMFTEPNTLKVFIIVLGFSMALIFINAYFIRKQELLEILNKLKREVRQ
ncbi:MAG: hypothetical protein WCY19_06770 [Candidatus Gastranaerophilaceae bacterium]